MAEVRPKVPLPLGSTIGILGGGQLGRMIALAASRLGFRTHVFCPESDSPAFLVTDRHSEASYDDTAALEAFAHTVDVVTFEFENVPADTAAVLSRIVPVRPDPGILAVTQDRLTEKVHVRKLGLEVAGFEPVSSETELRRAIDRLGMPAVLKTRRLGYDGKGQWLIAKSSDEPAALEGLRGAPGILEAFVPFEREVSAIVVRGADGTVRAFDIPENRHENHILRSSSVPASIAPSLALEARRIGESIARSFDYVGVVAVELFVVPDGKEGRLVVNEIAPRVHNSGHWTENACQVSQFEMHVRAIAGWPLPEPRRFCDVEMRNLIGFEINDALALAARPDSTLHVYGKREARPGRKMGHLNRLLPPSSPRD